MQSENWVCPLVEEIGVLNDPWLYRAGPGMNIVMIVNSCQKAKDIEARD